MSCLELETGEAEAWFAANVDPHQEAGSSDPEPAPVRQPRLHLLVGDSIARRARFGTRSEDQVLNRAAKGETWTSLENAIDLRLSCWQTAAAASGMTMGSVLIWLTGNDVYNRFTLLSSFDRDRLGTVGATAQAVIRRFGAAAEEVLVLGPLPRLAGELVGVTWETTAAYHLERTLCKLDLQANCRIVPLGRSLTRKMGRKRRGLKGTEQWYKEDGIHLSAEGYHKIAEAGAFPGWLTLCV